MPCQVKICGLTDAEEARACCAAGADAIGVVFHPASPRHVTPDAAARLVAALPPAVRAVGVFVHQDSPEIVRIARQSGLHTVQLHGPRMPATASLRQAGLRIVRVLFDPVLPVPLPDADAFLIECGRGALPGGNGVAWDWSCVAGMVRDLARPCGLAGGLSPRNAAAALRAVPGAVALDASSGVERHAGQKDMAAVRRFVEAVHGLDRTPPYPVF